MDFTREPIIETVITPKEGCKLVVRSSKSAGQEEHFVDAVEVVSFGNSFFFRSQERPKAFLVPASDYEVLEVREARMVLKNVGMDRSIKIGGGTKEPTRAPKEQPQEKVEVAPPEEEVAEGASAADQARVDKKRDRRRHSRRRRGREDGVKEEGSTEESASADQTDDSRIELPMPQQGDEEGPVAASITTPSTIPSLLPPPTTLIAETIAKYKENVLFKNAFYSRDEEIPASVETEAAEEPKEVEEVNSVKDASIEEESVEEQTQGNGEEPLVEEVNVDKEELLLEKEEGDLPIQFMAEEPHQFPESEFDK